MKKLNKKAKVLNFEKSISSTKEYFFKPKDGIKNEFYDRFGQKEKI